MTPAGIHDVYLTEYGKLQAQRAGQARSGNGALPHCAAADASPQDIKRRGTKFDAVFVSHMRRARQTCCLVLETADPACDVEHVIDARLAEKSFGIFAGRNINVLRMARGVRARSRRLRAAWRAAQGSLNVTAAACSSLRQRLADAPPLRRFTGARRSSG